MSKQIYSHRELADMLRPILKKYSAAGALLFGSYARNEATANSDIDLVILESAAFRPTDVFSIAEELHLCSGKAVDVYALQELNKGSEIYAQILREGVPMQ